MSSKPQEIIEVDEDSPRDKETMKIKDQIRQKEIDL